MSNENKKSGVVKTLAIEAVRLVPELRSRNWEANISRVQENILSLREALERGETLPPIEAMETADEGTVLCDGEQRLEAHRQLGRTEIQVKVFVGTRLDAKRKACLANLKSGLPANTDADKHRRVEMFLSEQEFVNEVPSVSAMAKKLATSESFMRTKVKELNIKLPEQRVTEDGREISTKNIGSKSKVKAAKKKTANGPPNEDSVTSAMAAMREESQRGTLKPDPVVAPKPTIKVATFAEAVVRAKDSLVGAVICGSVSAETFSEAKASAKTLFGGKDSALVIIPKLFLDDELKAGSLLNLLSGGEGIIVGDGSIAKLAGKTLCQLALVEEQPSLVKQDGVSAKRQVPASKKDESIKLFSDEDLS